MAESRWASHSPEGRAQSEAIARVNTMFWQINRLRIAQQRMKTALAHEHEPWEQHVSEFADALQEVQARFQGVETACEAFRASIKPPV